MLTRGRETKGIPRKETERGLEKDGDLPSNEEEK